MNIDTTTISLYAEQLEEKNIKVKRLFKPFNIDEIEVFASEPAHYRMRSEFRVWHEGEDLYYYMFDKALDKKIRTEQFLPASILINDMMTALMDKLRPHKILRHKLFQVDFLSTLSGEILVTLLYHRQLEGEWLNAAREMLNSLRTHFNVNIIGRARKQKFELDCDFVIEKLQVAGKEFIYKQIENSFTQPNAKVAIKMLEWAVSATKGSRGDLLELYCGNGNFSIALASNFRKVLATELAGPSVQAAQFNIEANKIENVQIIRMSSEDFSSAIAKKRDFQRLKGIDLNSYECSTIFVDPPRSGLDSNTIALVSKYERILYISCNLETLIENIQSLSGTHTVVKVALFDQFPYTDHVECGVLLASFTPIYLA